MRTAVLLLLLSTLVQAQHEEVKVSPSALIVFGKYCSACHGQNGKGGRGPDLTSASPKWGSSDADLTRIIEKGIPGTAMPAFPLKTSETRQLVDVLKAWRSGEPDDMKPGNALAGSKLFFSSGCTRCHMLEGRGGRLGPALDALNRGKSVREIRKSILEPSAALMPGFETGEAITKSGVTIRGVVKNEDTFSAQMMDAQEKLHLLLRSDLKQFRRPRESLMPKLSFTAEQAQDIAQFLAAPVREGLPPLPEWKPAADFDVTYERLLKSSNEPQNWLTYWGDFRGTHSSQLKQITPANAGSLRSAWAYQFGGPGIETMPIVVGGLMFVTGPRNDAAALDARTGSTIWQYRRVLPEGVHHYCTVMTNRGFAVLHDRVYMATLDTHLVSLDAKTGNVVWDVAVDDFKKGYSITHAPLAINGMIIVGATAGECALNGFIDAYDAATGKRLWRFETIAQPGDPARATWAGKSAETAGGPAWMTGTYDVETDTLFWTTGNPSPDYDGSVRAGDNLYTCSVIALDPKTGRRKWHFQFTPHDTHDWDANEAPVLIDAEIDGKMRKLLIQANRNAFYYVLDRTTGEFLRGKAFAKQTWAKGLDAKGRPIVIPGTDPTPQGVYVCPDAGGATNWASPSYDAKLKLFFVPAKESCATYTSKTKDPVAGDPHTGSGPQDDNIMGHPGAIRALDPTTGDLKWEFPLQRGSASAGVLSTAGGVLFASSADGHLIALESRTGKPLWHYQTGAEIRNSPISYAVDGKQYIALAGSTTLLVFCLP